MRIIVTGGAGFIGSNVTRHRLSAIAGEKIRKVDLLRYAGDERSASR